MATNSTRSSAILIRVYATVTKVPIACEAINISFRFLDFANVTYGVFVRRGKENIRKKG